MISARQSARAVVVMLVFVTVGLYGAGCAHHDFDAAFASAPPAPTGLQDPGVAVDNVPVNIGIVDDPILVSGAGTTLTVVLESQAPNGGQWIKVETQIAASDPLLPPQNLWTVDPSGYHLVSARRISKRIRLTTQAGYTGNAIVSISVQSAVGNGGAGFGPTRFATIEIEAP